MASLSYQPHDKMPLNQHAEFMALYKFYCIVLAVPKNSNYSIYNTNKMKLQ